jgi:anaerobic magnesium-protoporphyrin IX monomethyl ester cyclase
MAVKPKMMLVTPPGGYFAERWSTGIMMPELGILYIAAVLEKEGFEVAVLPSHVLGMDDADVIREVGAYKPDVVGVTCTTENRFESFRLIRMAKQAYPEMRTIIGGPHPTHTAQDCLQYIPELDMVSRGEGESTALELLQALEAGGDVSDLRKIQGLSFRVDGKIEHNEKRTMVRELDDFPMPARHLIPYEKYNFTMDVPGVGRLPACNLMTTRGCPFTCTFCATPTNWGRAVRAHSIARVVDEIEHCMEVYGSRAVWFYDDTFNVSKKRMYELCNTLIERELNVKWFCEVRIDLLDRPLLEKMHEAGLYYMGFGVESGSERIRREVILKKFDRDQARRVLNWCNELGVIPNPFYIFSHPTETWEDALQTIDIMEEFNGLSTPTVSVMHVYPGTPMERTARELSILPEDFTWTSEDDERVVTLPAVQGHVPLFVHKLTWAQVCELMFRWSFIGGRHYTVWKKVPKVLRSVRNWGDFKRYFVMGLVYARIKGAAKLRKWTGREKPRPKSVWEEMNVTNRKG